DYGLFSPRIAVGTRATLLEQPAILSPGVCQVSRDRSFHAFTIAARQAATYGPLDSEVRRPVGTRRRRDRVVYQARRAPRPRRKRGVPSGPPTRARRRQGHF